MLLALEGRSLLSTFTVDNPTDTPIPGETDLRQAIAMANSSPGANTINFDAIVFGTPQTIGLAGSQLELTNATGTQTIEGPAAGVTIDAGGSSRVFQVDPSVTATLIDLTITGGLASGGGAGVKNYGTSTLEDCIITGNSAAPGDNGGGLYNFEGSLSLSGCTIGGNSAGDGGGLMNFGAANLTGCSITGNTATRGGGLFNVPYSPSGPVKLSVSCSQIDGNSAFLGGGAYNYNGTGTFDDCGIGGNSAYRGGGLYNVGIAAATGCTIAGNSATLGGGAFNARPSGGRYDLGTTTLTDCTVSGNNGFNGGGLYSAGAATVAGCTFQGNSANYGGGIGNSGSTTVTGGAFLTNTSTGNAGAIGNIGTLSVDGTLFQGDASSAGGAIALVGNFAGFPGTAQLSDCTFDGDTATFEGGAVFVGSTTATITGCTFEDEGAGANGGGIEDWGAVTVVGGSFLDDTSGGNSGAIDNIGTLSVTGALFQGDSAQSGGGAIESFGGFAGFPGTTQLQGCTFEDNTAGFDGGGVVIAAATATVTDCTFSGNEAGGFGGGIQDYGAMTLADCTISGNSAAVGGGISGTGTTTLGNTIVAGNTAATGPDAAGSFTSQGNNLVGEADGSSGWVGSDLTGTVAQPLNPLLAPLGDYGGPTPTMALLPGSPAIDAGNNALIPAGVTTDQRGRPRIVGAAVDIGAFESSGFTIAVVSGSCQSTGVLTAFPAPLVVKVAARNPIEPVAGGLVTFTPPSSGASATIIGSPATIGASGTAIVNAAADGLVGSFTVSASAGGVATPARFGLTNAPLILVLDPAAAGALSLSGNASISIAGAVYVDSSSSSALSAGGNARVKASAIDVHGKVQKGGNASLSPTPVTGAAVLAATALPPPSTAGLTNRGSVSLAGNASATIQPGIYSQISVSGNARLTMGTGVYIIEGGGFSVSGNASVAGSGVLIVNAGSRYPTSTGGTYGRIAMSGDGRFNLSPPTSGTYAGIVFFQPPDNTQPLTVTCNASGVTGTIDAPSAPLIESGDGAIAASLLVDTLAISGNGQVEPPALATTGCVAGSTAAAATAVVGIPDPLGPTSDPAGSGTGLMALDIGVSDAITTAAAPASWVAPTAMRRRVR